MIFLLNDSSVSEFTKIAHGFDYDSVYILIVFLQL